MTDPVADARAAIAELRQIIEDDMTADPRNLQVEPGPSQIGTPCDRCLIHLLAGTPQQQVGAPPWLPWVGKAIHDFNEMSVIRHQIKTGSADWVPEGSVTVGQINGVDISGHADVFHIPSGTVVDYKLVGTTTMRRVRVDGSGTSATYRNQFHLYGRGYQLLGYDVRAVAGWYMPRNGMTLADSRYFIEPYDEQVALRALARATQFAQWITAFGAEQVLTGASPHTGQEFSCQKYADSVAAPAATVTADTFLSV